MASLGLGVGFSRMILHPRTVHFRLEQPAHFIDFVQQPSKPGLHPF